MAGVGGSYTTDSSVFSRQLALVYLGQTSTHPSWPPWCWVNQMKDPVGSAVCAWQPTMSRKCALASLESHRHPNPASSSRPPLSSRLGRRPLPYLVTGPCFRFNAGSCNSTNCRFEHVWSTCSTPGHPEMVCPELKGRARSRQGDTKLGASLSRTTPAAKKPRH